MSQTSEILTKQSLNTGDNQIQPLRNCISRALQNYFSHLGEEAPANLYAMVVAEIEIPLFEVVIQHTRGNQSKAASILGISRGTLRKKLKSHNISN